jgi:hypothetical protein
MKRGFVSNRANLLLVNLPQYMTYLVELPAIGAIHELTH